MFRALVGGQAEEIIIWPFVARFFKIAKHMESPLNYCKLVKKTIPHPVKPPKKGFLTWVAFFEARFYWFVSALGVLNGFLTGVLLFLPFGRLLDPNYPFFVGSVGFDRFFSDFCWFCHSAGIGSPTIAHDCPTIAHDCPRLPTITHDCPTIAHDCPRLPHDCPRLPTIAPRLPTIAHDCPRRPKAPKVSQNSQKTKEQRKTLKKRQAWQKRKRRGSDKKQKTKTTRNDKTSQNHLNQTPTKITEWAFKIETNSRDKKTVIEAKIARVSGGLRLFGSFLRSRAINTTESKFSLPLTTDWSSKHFYCLRCENWQHAEDEHKERSQRIPKNIVMANFIAGLQEYS